MTTLTTSDSSTYSLTISPSMVLYNSRTDSDENDSKYTIESYVCPVGRLSDRDEEILIVHSLPQQIEPNHHVSQVVDRAIARHAERVDRQTELVENRFKSINDEIECRIVNASQVLDECLNFIDDSLANVLGDRQSDEYMQFDLLRTCFLAVDELITRRDRKIDDFMNALRDLEKERTALVEDCHKRYMLDVKRLSADSYAQLYEKYLKDYNAIKLGNFRTYENLRFKLVQSSASVRHEFALRAHDVKLKIKNNVAQNFMETFKTAAAIITSDKLSTSRTKSINLLRELNGWFVELTQRSKYDVDVAFVSECSDSLKKHSDALDAIVDGTTPLHDEVLEEIQLLLRRTVDEYVSTITDSGEHLSPDELTVVNDEMSVEASAAQREKIKNILDVQLFLNEVKHAIEAIDTVLGPAVGIVHGHLKRLTEARNTVMAALETTFRRNDSKSNTLENQLDVALDALLRASDETDVIQYGEICDDTMEHIKNRTEVGRKREYAVVSNFKVLMASELEEAIRSEAQKIHVNVATAEFNYATQSEYWTESIMSAITSFKTALKTCQQTLHKELSSFIAKLKFLDFSNTECALANFKSIIDERFNVKTKVFELRTIALRDGIVNKRLDEFEQHRSLLECHVKDAREKSDSLRHDTEQMYKIFGLKTNDLILKNIELVRSHVEELSLHELAELIEKLRRKIDSVADELNNTYKSHYDKVQSDYQTIEDLTLEFIKSIKTFPEGGNYGDEEAVFTVDALNVLRNAMSREQSNIIKTLTKHSYESIIEIKELLGRMMKPLEIELSKKACKQTYNSINKLVNIAVSQDVSKLEKNMAILRAKLHNVKTVLEKGEINESSKCWSEMLSETKAFMGFLIQSFRDIKSLLKSKIKSSIWNSEKKKAYTSSVISVKSTKTFFSSGEFEFLDYGKSIVIQSETTGNRRFLNNVYLSISHYISESQKNAADLALAESSASTLIGKKPNATKIFNEIMDKALRRSKTIVLQAELIWIVTLSDFFDFLCREYHGTESEFKNAVLMTYHEESVTKMDVAFAAFNRESIEIRKWLKKVREEINYMLKPSHGHPLNAQRLENLLADFRRANSECLDTLTDTCTGTETKLKKIVENYEKECPKDVFEAITLSVKRYSKLKAKLDSINIKVIDVGNESEIMSETMANRITVKDTVQLALNNVKGHLRTEPGAVFWPENKLLWTNNVQDFRKLCRDRLDEVQVFSAVEKSKSIDWATNFVRDVERVMGFYDDENNSWRALL